MKRIFLIFTAICAISFVSVQKTFAYIYPTEPKVLETLDKWQDLKFGIIIHWGLYSYLDCVESWNLCYNFNEGKGRPSTMTYDEYKQWYWSAINSLSPQNFNPEQWAETAKAAGMKYLVFTTKHHDGFCLFDTKQTDFSIMHGAFKDNPRANVTKEVFNAFREQDFMIGAYFSKPDWHNQDYWWDAFATPDHVINYDPRQYPEKWTNFKNFTYNQLEELMNGDYGKLDILWLDGNWVKPSHTFQNIDMPRIATMARGYNPGVLIVDRASVPEYENYETPEQEVPDTQIITPWESCMTLGHYWNYRTTDYLKTSAKVIHSLIEIVAKGGSLNLGVGPKPDGTLPDLVIQRLNQIGEWLNKNGNAIYATRPTPVYNDANTNTWFTQSKDGQKIYAIVCLPENSALPTKVSWTGNEPLSGSTIKCLQTNTDVQWQKTSAGIEVTLPAGLPANLPAIAFELRNPNSSIDYIGDTKIRAADGNLYVENHYPNIIRIYTLNGRLLHQEKSVNSITTITLPKGAYVVQSGNVTQKVVL
ncbi:MAG: alpha-L-fucosidase [Tannerella sp.]|jgi:alpha-L-fucosidase|nr:alpha-L-fucosidase [Tannerella sp.]